MPNPMDNMPFSSSPQSQQNTIENLIQQARQNPQAFEEYIHKNNPRAYQQAMQIRNSPNPQAIAVQMAQAKGINPNIFRMLGIM